MRRLLSLACAALLALTPALAAAQFAGAPGLRPASARVVTTAPHGNTAGHCAEFTAGNRIADAGGACGTGSGTGTVTSVGISSTGGTIGVTGSPITSAGTFNLDLPSSGVTAGSYTNANITVGADGVISAASNGSGGSSCANPCTIGSSDIRAGSGAPTATDAEGSLFMRSDTGQPYQMNGSQAPITYVQGAITNFSNSVTLPSAPTAGDILIAEAARGSGPASGWTQFYQWTSAVGDSMTLVWHLVGTGESATQTPFTSATSAWSVAVFEIHGAPASFSSTLVSVQTQNHVGTYITSATLATADDLVIAMGTYPAGGGGTMNCGTGSTSLAGGSWGASSALALGTTGVVGCSTSGGANWEGQTIDIHPVVGNALGWQPISNLNTIQSGGVTVSTRPFLLNFSTGLAATDDGLGDETITATIAGANPSASLGLSAVNGSASTFMRSDAAPALSQAIAPTWTGVHTFAPTAVAAPSAVAEQFTPSVSAGTSNHAGANTTFKGSQGTGTGAGGAIVFQTAAPGTSGTAQNAEASVFQIGPDGTTQIAKTFTVATLPACAAGTKGEETLITDGAASPAWDGVATGGGSLSLKVVCDGTNWTYQ